MPPKCANRDLPCVRLATNAQCHTEHGTKYHAKGHDAREDTLVSGTSRPQMPCSKNKYRCIVPQSASEGGIKPIARLPLAEAMPLRSRTGIFQTGLALAEVTATMSIGRPIRLVATISQSCESAGRTGHGGRKACLAVI